MKPLLTASLIAAVILLSACAPQSRVVFVGALIDQKYSNGFFYDTMTYTILTTDNLTHTFRVRGGWPMIQGETYVFTLAHIEANEFTARSIEVVK